MLILCFSDSHGNPENFERAIKAHPNAELAFFLGDGLSDAEYAAYGNTDKMWLAVRGNCDFKTDFKSVSAKFTEEITLYGKKIIMTHGHIYSAKSSLYGLMELASDRCADVVLFGHTHTPTLEARVVGERTVYLFNPGALQQSYFGVPTYGTIDISENGIKFAHHNLN